MIRDALQHLEDIYRKNNDEEMCIENIKEKENDIFSAYSTCLLQGVKPKVYTPLLKRDKCCKCI